MRDITEAEFASAVVQASHTQPVVVDFWAPWCGPCHQLSPIIERVAARYASDVGAVKLNVDEAPAVAQQYRVQGIPAVKAFRDGAATAEFVGVQPEAGVEQFFAALAPSEADRLVARAATDGAHAEDLLRQALETDPGHADAVVALARILADRGEESEARALLARVPGHSGAAELSARLELGQARLDGEELAALRAKAAGGDATASLRLGRGLAAAGEHAAALEHLLSAATDSEVRDEAREAVLAVYRVLGDDHDLVKSTRPRLARALF